MQAPKHEGMATLIRSKIEGRGKKWVMVIGNEKLVRVWRIYTMENSE